MKSKSLKEYMTELTTALSNLIAKTKVTETQTFTACGKVWTFRRIGNVVWFDAPNDGSGIAAGNNSIGTLRESMRPGYTVRLPIANMTQTLNFVNITTAGVITLYSTAASSGARNCATSGSYIVGGGTA